MKCSKHTLCNLCEEKLATLSSNDIRSAEEEALAEHVAACSGCADIAAEYREIDTLLSTVLIPTQPLHIEKAFLSMMRDKRCRDDN